jgi:hypothetical protein
MKHCLESSCTPNAKHPVVTTKTGTFGPNHRKDHYTFGRQVPSNSVYMQQTSGISRSSNNLVREYFISLGIHRQIQAGELWLWEIFFGGPPLGRGHHKGDCRNAGLSGEALCGPKFKFRILRQKFRSVNLINGFETPEFHKSVSGRSR